MGEQWGEMREKNREKTKGKWRENEGKMERKWGTMGEQSGNDEVNVGE